ncbi:MAG TPA: hypothetical protein VF680_17280 [Allosphingosinicella sp.]|jgi:hypothetical protein
MIKYIIVQADTNDGDYINKKTQITEDDIIKVKDILSKLNIGSYDLSWGRGDIQDEDNDPHILYPQLSEEEIEFLENYIPYGEYGIHTIESIEILTVVETEKLI